MADGKKVSASKSKKKKNIFKRLARYFRDTAGEFKKISWPSRKTAFNNTLVVVGFMAAVGVFVWSVDFILALLVNLFVGG